MFISYYSIDVGVDDVSNEDLMTNSWNDVGLPLTSIRFPYTNYSNYCRAHVFYANHGGQVMHIYLSVNKVFIDSDNGVVPIQHQAIIWANDILLSIGPLGTNII